MSDTPHPREPTLLELQPATDLRKLARMAEQRLESKHFDAIGRVAVSWSFFEAEIDAACINLASIEDERGVCLTSQITGSARKLDAFLSLSRLHSLPEDLNKRLNKFYDDARHHAERRNRVIHDPWLFDHPNPPLRYEATARKTLRIERVPMTTELVYKLIEDITNLRSEFMGLEMDVQRSRQPSPKKSKSNSRL